MKAFIDYTIPDPEFWSAYEQLWENSKYRPVFESPGLLRYFSSLSEGAVAIFKCFRENGQLTGAAFFHKKKNVYTFLSDYKTDHSCFVLHQNCTNVEIRNFFEAFHQEVLKEHWTLELNNNPMWVSYMDAFTRSGKKSPLFWLSTPSTVCPRLEEKDPESLRQNLLQSRNNRYKRKRLQREHQVEFEVLSDEEDLVGWTTDFCNTHVRRWQNTLTPSKYHSEQERNFLQSCLQAWEGDGRLVRFALKANGTRIAFVIGLLQKNSLIYHSLTYHPDFHKYSPGKVLILYLGEWMHEHRLNVLDFGDGNEPYKYNFANKEQKLHAIFISKKENLFFILRAKVIAAVRRNPVLIKFYREKLRPWLNMAASRLPKVQLRKFFLFQLPMLELDYLSLIV
ncbi:MAG: GNAT family N-acetyltransferase [Lewinellaceae bacterium]|nr:GNAT family N-acetyltransferase [Lewinellaceae bacterium]